MLKIVKRQLFLGHLISQPKIACWKSTCLQKNMPKSSLVWLISQTRCFAFFFGAGAKKRLCPVNLKWYSARTSKSVSSPTKTVSEDSIAFCIIRTSTSAVAWNTLQPTASRSRAKYPINYCLFSLYFILFKYITEISTSLPKVISLGSLLVNDHLQQICKFL